MHAVRLWEREFEREGGRRQNPFSVSRTRGWVHLPPPEAVPYPCFTLVSLFPTLFLRFVPYLGFGEGGKIRDA